MPLNFTEESIDKIFGKEAAEDEFPERFVQYFMKSTTFDRVNVDLPLRILVGHKGVGKSALLKMCSIEDKKRNILTVRIQPDDVLRIYEQKEENILNLIQIWKDGLRAIMLDKVIKTIGHGLETSPYLKILSKTGNLISVLFDIAKSKLPDAVDPAVRSALDAFSARKKIRIYIDDLDRGWEGRPIDIKRVSALLNALRDLAREYEGLQFRLGLRSDVYYLVRTSDESTDKIDGSVIWLSWTNHEILALLVKRIETFFDRPADEAKLLVSRQSDLARFLDPVMDPFFSAWENGRRLVSIASCFR
jgi:hypothetical protein